MTKVKRAAKKSAKATFIDCIMIGLVTGFVTGLVCDAFCLLTTLADSTRQDYPVLLFGLPLAGLLIVFCYEHVDSETPLGMPATFDYAYGGKRVSPWLAPLIAMSTILAYLFGGSCGRVGSALQLSGSVNSQFTRFFAKDADPQLITACAFAAGFSALLDAPLAGAIFGAELLILSNKQWYMIFSALVSTGIAWGFAHLTGIPYISLHVDAADLVATIDVTTTLKVVLLAICTTLLGRGFVYGRRLITRLFGYISNVYLRVLAGTVLVILITLALGTGDYNGNGFGIVAVAMQGNAEPLAFVWKFLLTALTLGCGIRGGEISPNIFIGSTFGCTFAALIGFDPILGAAVGLVGVLSSVTKSTLGIFVLGLEIVCFSPITCYYLAICCLITHFLSGPVGLYPAKPEK